MVEVDGVVVQVGAEQGDGGGRQQMPPCSCGDEAVQVLELVGGQGRTGLGQARGQDVVQGNSGGCGGGDCRGSHRVWVGVDDRGQRVIGVRAVGPRAAYRGEQAAGAVLIAGRRRRQGGRQGAIVRHRVCRVSFHQDGGQVRGQPVRVPLRVCAPEPVRDPAAGVHHGSAGQRGQTVEQPHCRRLVHGTHQRRQ
ncbi:hypothetical protein ACIBO1_19995 [Micromonospora sp. NPDC049903]|uniref:hypothetical protein n=1 Tax=Micromonospora sp. NPDC049903 TaxID=3364276 RepID=UPI0037B37F71